MNRCVGFMVLLGWSMVVCGQAQNLLREPLNISNVRTTVFHDGVYTVVNPGASTVSRMTQDVVLNQTAVKPLTFSVEVKSESPTVASNCYFGVAMDLFHQDGTRNMCVNIPAGSGTFDWRQRQRVYLPKKPVKRVRFYLQYTRDTGTVHFRKPFLCEGAVASSPRRHLSPLEMARLRYKPRKLTLKDRHLDTYLVRDGKAVAALVGDAALVARVNAVIQSKSGVVLPVLSEHSYGDAERLDRNLIMVGNRDRNRSLSNLYNRHFTLLDARYPGEGGSEVRSLHNPFGDGHNVILCGGSDLSGDRLAVEKLVRHLSSVPSGRDVKLGFLSDVTLSPKYKVARDVKDIPLWEESFGYGKSGYFGWNSLAKNLAMLYITNDPYYKDEFLRLAFPRDVATRDELFRRDDEAYRDRRNPIVKVYHYRGTSMALYWDLVDENPLFTDAERLKVTQAFYDQLICRLTQPDYWNPHNNYLDMKLVRPGRHTVWEALLVWTTSRYLHKDYPCEATRAGLQFGRHALEPLFEHTLDGQIALFWLTTSLEMQFYYGSLQGHRLVGNPRLRDYARALTSTSDLSPGNLDRSGRFSTPWSLFAGAYLAQDQGLIQLAMQKTKPGIGPSAQAQVFDYDVFRLGQSFWPVKPYGHNSIVENLGKWNTYVNSVPEKPSETHPMYCSYRSRPDDTGDFLLVDPFYRRGLREPQHVFSLLWGTLRGAPILRGFENALIPYADGLADLKQPFEGKILSQGVSGEFVWITGLASDFNGFDWERTWLLRKGEYLLAVDKLTAKRDMMTARFDNRFSTFTEYAWKPCSSGDQMVETSAGTAYLSCSAEARAHHTSRSWSQLLGGGYVTYGIKGESVGAGEVFRFASVVRLGEASALPSSAQHEHLVGVLTPAPGLLTFTPEGFEWATGKESFSLRGGRGDGTRGGKAEVEARALEILRQRKPTPPEEVVLAEKLSPVCWRTVLSSPAGGMHVSGDCVAVSSGTMVTVLDVRTGRQVFQRDMKAEVSALSQVPERSLWLVGCKNEKLYGLDQTGAVVWEFTSEMAPEMEFNGPYHHKCTVPGIRSLGLTNGRIYVGSAGTMEVLDYEGKLVKRLYVLYGAVDEQIPVPGTQDVMLRRRIGGWPAIHLMKADLTVRYLGRWSCGLHDDLGYYGFSQVNKEALVYFQNSRKQWRVADLFCGVQNRLVLRERDGHAVAEVNFGGAGSATNVSRILGCRAKQIRLLRDLVVNTLEEAGQPTIAVGHRDHLLYVFTEDLRLRKLVTLPAVPRKMIAGDRCFLVGLDNGLVVEVGKTLNPVVIGKVPSMILDMKRVGELVLVSCDDGTVCALRK